MTQAVAARRDGDTFQARIFWQKALQLLDAGSPIVRVGFESGPKGFDDVWLDYEPARAPLDHEGNPLLREHLQCKWHVSPNTYGYQDIVSPDFIHAASRSLLERARGAQLAYAPKGTGVRFRLMTNWRIDRQDPLRELVHLRHHNLRLDRFRKESGKLRALRELWSSHLQIDAIELEILVRTLAFSEALDSLDDFRERLEPYLSIAGLQRVPRSTSAFIYDEVIYQWMNQGRLEFDRPTFRAACQKEGLFTDKAVHRPVAYGVKSFEHPIERIEERCTRVLDLLPHFYERQIRPEADWGTTIFPALQKFLMDAARTTEHLRLVLDAHTTLAFAAGTVLNIKAGKAIELEQRTLSRDVWSADDKEPDPAWPGWNFERETLNQDGPDNALAISVTHDVSHDVGEYVARAIPTVSTLDIARIASRPGSTAVKCGRHAFDLAETLVAHARSMKTRGEHLGRLHLFYAGPNALMFYLGQRQALLGPLTVYEYDFEGTQGGSYCSSLSLPMPSHNSA